MEARPLPRTARPTARPTWSSGHEELAVELSRAIGRGWRGLRRTVGKELGEQSQPELEVELLRLTAVRPGLRVSEAAAELGLAPNTVSTVVTRLVERGLLERARDDADHRAVRLKLTALGKGRRAARRDIRRGVVAAALYRLSEKDRRTLSNAMPALARLVEELRR